MDEMNVWVNTGLVKVTMRETVEYRVYIVANRRTTSYW
jgi:hypothetical protein